MSTVDLKELVKRELSKLAPEADLSTLDERADVRAALDLDSMDILRFANALKDRLGVDIPESDYAKIVSLGGCVAYLQAHSQ